MFYNFKKHQLRFVTVVSVIVSVVVGFNLFMRPHHLILSSNPCDLHAWFHTKLLLRDLHQGHRAARRGCCCLCRSWHRAWHCGTVPSTGEAQWGGESQQREHYTTIRHDAAEVVTRLGPELLHRESQVTTEQSNSSLELEITLQTLTSLPVASSSIFAYIFQNIAMAGQTTVHHSHHFVLVPELTSSSPINFSCSACGRSPNPVLTGYRRKDWQNKENDAA